MNCETARANVLAATKRIVVKLGSSVVTNDRGLDHLTIEGIVDDIHDWTQKGKEFIIVSSGAIAAGVKRLNLREGARTIPQKQAAASVGQTRLMATYEDAFAAHGRRVAQILLTKDDLANRRRYLNARNTLTTLLSWGVIPVVNENDTVMVEEIKLGDNDNLSALVAALMDANLLIALTDTEGLMDCDPVKNPGACLIPLVEEITPGIRGMAQGSSSTVGRGGMASKLNAAAKAGRAGIPTIIARGKTPDVLSRVLSGEMVGTLILPEREPISARKHWIRFNPEPEGVLIVDSGAAKAIRVRGTSLLPVGIRRVVGTFEHGAPVSVRDDNGKELARGLSNYSSEELDIIKGRHTAEIDWVLGYRRNEEAIHADNLILMEEDITSEMQSSG